MPNALSNFVDIRTNSFADVCHFVDEADLGRQHAVGGILDHLRAFDAYGDEWFFSSQERFVKFEQHICGGWIVNADNDTIRRVANLMRGRSIGCVVVTRDGELEGIITVSDLLGLLGKGQERPAPATRAHLHYRVPHRKQHRGRSW